jgi:LmbE family N-acetylglucosaminyl deacetylase
MEKINLASNAFASGVNQEGVVIDKEMTGKPHRGKVLAAVQSNLSDIPFFAGGTCARLINEGYTGYLIRTSNDEKNGSGSIFQNVFNNNQENLNISKVFGFSDVFELYYRQHEMNGISLVELRGRLMYIFRLLKVDTVITFNPSSENEDNPDRWVTGQAVEQACFMAGNKHHYPEHEEAGLTPHSVKERYYIVAQSGQPFNRVIDISSTIEKKIDAIIECKSLGVSDSGSLLRKRLAKEGKKLSILGNDDRTANREYIRHFLLAPNKTIGEHYNLSYAERFLYFSKEDQLTTEVENYIKKYAETM